MFEQANTTAPMNGVQDLPPVAFVGGGNIATAIVTGLLGKGMPAQAIFVVDPSTEARSRLQAQYGLPVMKSADERIRACHTVVWAVKPQDFRRAAEPVWMLAPNALHLSVAAGIRTQSIAGWLHTDRIVRAMPNTPALIGKGITGLYSATGASAADRGMVELLLRSTGELMWFEHEHLLEAVTALSGTGPAYVFYFLESMVRAAMELGLDEAAATKLCLSAFAPLPPLFETLGAHEELQARMPTSALNFPFDNDSLRQAFIRAIHAARERAASLGDEFGIQ